MIETGYCWTCGDYTKSLGTVEQTFSNSFEMAIFKASQCGANQAGGGGFAQGNTCAGKNGGGGSRKQRDKALREKKRANAIKELKQKRLAGEKAIAHFPEEVQARIRRNKGTLETWKQAISRDQRVFGVAQLSWDEQVKQLAAKIKAEMNP